MAEFMVESYVRSKRPTARLDATAEAVFAAREQSRRGPPVRYLRSIFIPADNTCFHVFEAPSLQTVREMSERASIGFERIVRVVQIERAMMPGSDPPGSDPATAPGRVVV